MNDEQKAEFYKRLIYIVKRILKAPVQLANGAIVTSDKDMPQGGIISPLLANFVPNELDWWVGSQWQNHPVAVARGRNRQKKSIMPIVRYADDFRIFCPTRDCAERTLIAVTQCLRERLRLDVSPERRGLSISISTILYFAALTCGYGRRKTNKLSNRVSVKKRSNRLRRKQSERLRILRGRPRA